MVKKNYGKKIYDAICSVCNDFCTVPFKPYENQKITCKSCYVNENYSVPTNNELNSIKKKVYKNKIKGKDSYESICSVCNDFCTVPFKPYENQKITCKNCYINDQSLITVSN